MGYPVRPAVAEKRSGMVIPLVLIALVIWAILGVTMMFSGSSEYSQAAIAGQGLRARELALGALEEARAVVYDQVSRPGPNPPAWKQALFDAIGPKAEAKDQGPVLPAWDITGMIPNAADLAARAGARGLTAKVEFYGFRRMAYVSTDLFLQDEIYYKDPDNQLDQAPGKIRAPREYYGHYRIDVSLQYGKVIRQVSSNHDVKVVLTLPFAREFALFSMLSTQPGQPGSPASDAFARGDLNTGGGFKIFGNKDGRIFLRGPYVMESEGYPDGTGGSKPDRAPSIWYPKKEWPKWKTVPAPREGRIASLFGAIFGQDPSRPKSPSGFLVIPLPFIYQPLLEAALFLGAGAILGAFEPGYAIGSGQQWYCEYKQGPAPGNTGFSIIGDPVETGTMNLFKGPTLEYKSGQRKPAGRTWASLVTAAETIGNGPGGDDDRMVLEPEGNVFGLYKFVEHKTTQLDIAIPPGPFWPAITTLYFSFNTTPKGQALIRYGLHWEPKRGPLILNAILSGLAAVGGAVMQHIALGQTLAMPFTDTLLNVGSGQLLGAGWAVALGTIGVSVGAILTRPGPMDQIANANPSNLKGAFPPEYRIVGRDITRYYPSLEGLPAMKKPGRVITLDGVLGFDSIDTTAPFSYKGRGVVYCDNPDRAPSVVLPVVPVTPPAANGASTDWLFLHYGGPAQGADGGQQMLKLPGGAGSGQGTFRGSIYSTQGVQPSPGQKVVIDGNLSCGYVNKGKIPPDARVSVRYNVPTLSTLDPAQAGDGRWHVISVSPRMSGLAITGGR